MNAKVSKNQRSVSTSDTRHQMRTAVWGAVVWLSCAVVVMATVRIMDERKNETLLPTWLYLSSMIVFAATLAAGLNCITRAMQYREDLRDTESRDQS